MSATAQRKKGLQAAPEPAQAETVKPADDDEPLLALSTASPKRPIITVDEQAHELAMMGDFDIVDQQALSRDGAEFQRLWSDPQELSKGDRARLKMLLSRLFPKALTAPLPAAVAGKLNDEQRAEIALVFIHAPRLTAALQAMREQAPEPGDQTSMLES